MADRTSHIWSYRATFVFLVAVVVFVQLLPLRPGPRGIPGPDVIILIAFSWIVMRPDFVPVALLAGVFLLADLLLMRPPGLWTALVVLGGEFLRSRQAQMRAASFVVEWAIVGLLICAVTVAYALILMVFGVPQPSLGLTILRLLFTILCYPLVVILAGRAFGLRKVRAGDQDGFGQRS
jgi:rod shape-determining protein MreD